MVKTFTREEISESPSFEQGKMFVTAESYGVRELDAIKAKSFLENLYTDNHYWSERPCATCDHGSRDLGFDVGCTRYRKEMFARRKAR